MIVSVIPSMPLYMVGIQVIVTLSFQGEFIDFKNMWNHFS